MASSIAPLQPGTGALGDWALTLEIPEAAIGAERDRLAQSASPSASQSGPQWRATIHRLALAAIEPWLAEILDCTPRPWPNRSAQTGLWKWFDGAVLRCGDRRIVVLATTAIDRDELRVPQEWVDLPDWCADYYLAAQVDPEAGLVTLWSYASHDQLKAGTYDSFDRSYSLTADHLYGEVALLGMVEESTRADLSPIALPSAVQAQSLIDRLTTEPWPRQAIPMAQWLGLISHGGWRQQLLDRQAGQPLRSVQDWWQRSRSALDSAIDSVVNWRPGSLAPIGIRSTPQDVLTRELVIVDRVFQLSILPIESVDSEGQSTAWRFVLRAESGLIPIGYNLTLLTEDLQGFEHNSDEAIEPCSELIVEVELVEGEGLVWEISPECEGYDREILRF
jgi:Protein of unknown function (DUF1822)